MRYVRLSIMALAMVAVSGLFGVSPAEASSWHCIRTTPSISVCLKTDKRDTSHISGANMQVTKLDGGCITGRFHHGVTVDGAALQIWSDAGAFTICQNETRSFYWTHSGAGAYVPPNGSVFGYFQAGSTKHYAPYISRSEI
ncbi:hypothetical protein Aph02nite_84530 [Actinoplanes philippinensis]|uniref:Peptidase inhibitor family I36 n=1 Tax=Actinoplanes philippinensis TaxID=35752 RepID=A0A1I2ER05_9ACTN|nr:hypothetical protein [Actinoplanes philippinensis]GIE82503.1 hypothetical protein Aph02nite_84530 [Actinoplanes philippinensis]SFE94898.1 hypothetical protein SAMN05421541_104641 [Actinoplanes philippinensis]